MESRSVECTQARINDPLSPGTPDTLAPFYTHPSNSVSTFSLKKILITIFTVNYIFSF